MGLTMEKAPDRSAGSESNYESCGTMVGRRYFCQRSELSGLRFAADVNQGTLTRSTGSGVQAECGTRGVEMFGPLTQKWQ